MPPSSWETRCIDIFSVSMWLSRKLRTVGFGVLEPHVYNKVVNACSENENLEDVTLTITDCKELSRTVDKMSNPKCGVKYLRFLTKGEKIPIPSDGGY